MLERMVTEQDALAERLIDAIIELGGLPDWGEFPIEFTDTHDLGIDYLIQEAIGYGRQDVSDLESIASTPNLESPADSLVADAVKLAKRQLATLEGFASQKPAAS
jgi:hypothetical protein